MGIRKHRVSPLQVPPKSAERLADFQTGWDLGESDGIKVQDMSEYFKGVLRLRASVQDEERVVKVG